MTNDTSTMSIRQLGGKLQFIRYIQDHAVLPEGSSSEFAVLISILDRTDGNGRGCYAKVSTIARGAYMSERSAFRAMKKLADAGLIVCTGMKKHPSGQSTKVWDVVAPIAAHREGVTDCHAKGCQSVMPRGDRLADNPSHDPSHDPSLPIAGHHAPSSHDDDPELTLATTHSVAPPAQAHGEPLDGLWRPLNAEEAPEGRGTPVSAVEELPAGASRKAGKAVDELSARWGAELDRIIDLTMDCAGGPASDELCSALRKADEPFLEWMENYGLGIPRKCAISRNSAIGVLVVKLRKYISEEGTWAA